MDENKRSASTHLLMVASLLVIIFLLAPLLVVVAISFTETNFLSFPPQGFSLKWYREVLDNPLYVDSFWLSIQVAALGTFIAVCLGVPASIILNRKRFFGSQLIESLFLSPLILPTIVLGVAILQFASAAGLTRTFLALLIGHTVLIIPYVVRATLATLANFDPTVEEAAQDLGATTWQTFRLVTLPQIKPGVIAGSLLGFVISWVNVEVSIFNPTMDGVTLPVRIFNQVQGTVDPSMAAISAITIYFAVATVLALDYFVGIEKTGMK